MRTEYDLEMLQEMGFCNGIENYSRILDGRPAGSAPHTLLDYFPSDYIVFVDDCCACYSAELHAATLTNITDAYGIVVRALVHIVGEMNTQITALEAELTSAFEQHADAEIVASLPGLGPVLGARALAEFGDDPARYTDAKGRRRQ